MQNLLSSTSILLIFGLLTFAGCSSEQGGAEEISEGVPELHPRAAGLDVGDFSMIEERYNRSVAALQNDPHNVDALVQLSQVFSYEARVTGDHPYYYPAAEKMIDRALAADPENYEAVITKAAVLLTLHRFQEAKVFAARAVAMAPNAAAPYGALVDANVELGNLEAAVEAADRMMAIRPDLKSYARVSYLRELHGDMEGAIEAMQLAVDAGAPGSEEKAWARKTLGDIYLSVAMLDEAEREYSLTIAERDRYPFALAGLAEVMIRRGDQERAVALLDEATAMVPEFSFVQTKADVYRMAGDNQQADALVHEVAGMLAEDEASGHSMNLEMARLYGSHRIELDEALRRAREESAKRPNSSEALDVLAFTLLQRGELEEAEVTITKALELAPSDGTILAHAGLIKIALGKEESGEKLLQQSRTLRPVTTPLLDHQVDQALGL